MSVRVQKVQRVNSAYVCDDIAQVMVPFKESYMSILNGEGPKYYFSSGEEHYNEYLDDTRRFQFPYYSIPTHKEKQNGIIVTYVNQIFDINKPYIILKDGKVIQDILLEVPHNFNSLLDVHRILRPVEVKSAKWANVDDLSEQINKIIGLSKGENFIFSDGGIMSDEVRYDDEQDVVDKETKIIVTVNGEDITSIKGFKIFKGNDNFKYMVFDFPMVEYTPSMFSSIASIAPLTKEPKIKRRLNPDVTRDAIIGSKTMVRFKERK